MAQWHQVDANELSRPSQPPIQLRRVRPTAMNLDRQRRTAICLEGRMPLSPWRRHGDQAKRMKEQITVEASEKKYRFGKETCLGKSMHLTTQLCRNGRTSGCPNLRLFGPLTSLTGFGSRWLRGPAVYNPIGPEREQGTGRGNGDAPSKTEHRACRSDHGPTPR